MFFFAVLCVYWTYIVARPRQFVLTFKSNAVLRTRYFCEAYVVLYLFKNTCLLACSLACHIDPNIQWLFLFLFRHTHTPKYIPAFHMCLKRKKNVFNINRLTSINFLYVEISHSVWYFKKENLSQNTRNEQRRIYTEWVYVDVYGLCYMEHKTLAIHNIKSMGMYAYDIDNFFYDLFRCCSILQSMAGTLGAAVDVIVHVGTRIIWCDILRLPNKSKECISIATRIEFILIDKAESIIHTTVDIQVPPIYVLWCTPEFKCFWIEPLKLSLSITHLLFSFQGYKFQANKCPNVHGFMIHYFFYFANPDCYDYFYSVYYLWGI